MRFCDKNGGPGGLSHPIVILRPMSGNLTISCEDCVMRDTSHCDDCVVTFICGRDPEDAVVIDAEEQRAVRLLIDAGLVPELRHRRRTG